MQACSWSTLFCSFLVGVVAVILLNYVQLQKELQDLKSISKEECPIPETVVQEPEPIAADPEPPKECAETEDVEPPFLETGSSVWCRGDSPSRRMCHFRYLCFNSDNREYVFLHGPGTVISGVPNSTYKQALVDLSSIEDHNILQLVYIDVPVESIAASSIRLVVQPSLLLYRFKPDNLMHVFHDDLIPIFFSLLEICGGSITRCPKDFQLAFMDTWPEGPHWDLYGLFTKYQPFMSTTLEPNALYCFKDAYVGLNRQSIWYQYGFLTPQSPWPNKTVTALDIRRFTEFFAAQVPQMSPTVCGADRIAVLLTRKITRLILNEAELMDTISQTSGMVVETMSLDEHYLLDIISHVQCADILIGMHGALLTLALFLKPGSIFIELFPYGVPPEDYTPYKTLATLPGMGVIYRTWRNDNEEDSVAHTDWDPELGGIEHLPEEEQEEIRQMAEVPQHLCCHNPTWLYRIYQDTSVDVSSFQEVLKEALQQQANFSILDHEAKLQELTKSNLLPGIVGNLTCNETPPKLEEVGFILTWRKPWNLEMLSEISPDYEIWIQGTKTQEFKATVIKETEFIIKDLNEGELYNVWVRCKLGEEKIGAFKYISCTAKKNKVNITY